MLHYSLRTAVPTESKSRGIFYDNRDIYFASNTYVYKVTEGQYSICGILQSSVRQIIPRNNILYAVTEDSLVLIHNKKNIASLRCNCISFSLSDKFIVLGNGTTLEIWYLPKEYKFGMFDLNTKIEQHNDEITCTYIAEERIYSGSKDCSVKYYDLVLKKTERFINTKSYPIKILRIKEHLVVVCEDGQIYYVNENNKKIENKIFKNTKISSADQFGDLICVCIQENNKSLVEIISSGETIYGVESHNLIDEISFNNLKVAMKSDKYVGLYNFEIDTFLFNLDLPKISCIDTTNELLGVGCADKKIRIYDDKRILNIFLTGSVLSISINGYISIFDMKNGTCFRSFNIPVKISATAVCDDGMLMFIADYETYKIRVIDLQRSREIDSLEGHESPVKHMVYSENHLFTLSVDNELKKWNVFKSDCVSADLEKTATDFVVRNKKIYVSLLTEILIYDFNLEYESSLFLREKKAVEHFDLSFDGKLIFLGGESNKISIMEMDSNNIEQTIKVSRNKKWKNYKDIIFKNQKKSCDKSDVIEVLDIIHSRNQHKVVFLSREGVFIYEKSTSKYLPLCLDIETTSEAISGYLESKKYLNALIASLKIKEISLIKNILDIVPEDQIEFIVKYIPENMVEDFRKYLINLISDRYRIQNLFRWMRYLIYYHGRGTHESIVCRISGEECYKQTLENIFMLENLIE
ncbi:hypothetical protein P3W45_001790 [Vairimorpha bombi]